MDLKTMNTKLADFPYLEGYTPSQVDVKEFEALGSQDVSKFKNVLRWHKHIKSFTKAETSAWPGAPSKPSKGGDDDDDLDLFGEGDDEEAEKAKVERAKAVEEAKKKKDKPEVVAKSSIVLDVKVYDDETDLNEIEKQVRSIEKEGLLWGAAKKEPVAFGMYKLQIVCVVEDEKVSVDWLTEQIEELEDVQSTDIAAFQKI